MSLTARQLSERAIKSDNEVRALISALQECAIRSLENINDTNKHCFEPKLCRELQLMKYIGKKIGVKVDREWCYGELQTFALVPGARLPRYNLTIVADEEIDGLPVIEYEVPQKEWF